MKKFLFSFLTPLFVSLFFFIPQVKADTYNLTFDTSLFDILSSSTYTTIKNTADTYCSSNNCTYYFSYKRSQGYRVNYYFPGSPSTPYFFQGSSEYFTYNIQGGGNWRTCAYNSSTGLEISCSSNQSYPSGDIEVIFSNNIINSYSLLYSNLSSSVFILSTTPPINTTNVYNLSYLNFSGSYSVSNAYIPSLYEIYQQGNIVPDSTPLLTQFFDISIEKLQLICDFFTSSYVYLSIFVIFILYFVILLLRRLK